MYIWTQIERNGWIKEKLNIQDILYMHGPPEIQDTVNTSESYKILNIHEILI